MCMYIECVCVNSYENDAVALDKSHMFMVLVFFFLQLQTSLQTT